MFNEPYPPHDGPTRVNILDLPDIEPSSNLGRRPDLRWVSKDRLCIDARYQRLMTGRRSTELVTKIVEEFSWPKFQPVTVVEMDGAYLVVDGQHRAAAAMLHPMVDEVPAWVIDAPDVRAQAKAFVAINQDRNAMNALQIFKAKLAAKDPDALQVKAVCERAGVTIVFNLSGALRNLGPRQTQAVSTIRQLISKHGERPVSAALETLVAAYPDVPGQIRSQIIQAVTSLFVQHDERIDRGRLVRTMADKDAEELLDAARKVRKLYGGSTEACLATALVKGYDKGLVDARKLQPAEPREAAA